MDWNWVVLIFCIAIKYGRIDCKEIIAQVNTMRWVQYVPERFLSMTVDPITVAAASPLSHESLNMARGLSPSFLRISGPTTNSMQFGKEFLKNNVTVTEEHLDSVNKFVQDAGLDLILGLNPMSKVHGVWDSSNSLEIISYSQKNGYDVAWQLGYDTNGMNVSGVEIGRNIVRLKKILDAFPAYSKTPIFGPDLKSVFGGRQVKFVKDILAQAGPILASVVVQPPFKDSKLHDEDPGLAIKSVLNIFDSYVWNKDNFKPGKTVFKKPVWIAETEPSEGNFDDAMSLLKKLGSAARLGCQVVLRQPGVLSLKQPTPEFWTALIYKNLVGRGVLDVRMISGNKNDIYIYSHCTPNIPQEKSILDTDWNYEKGSITIFGVNQSPENVNLNLRASVKEEALHIYMLTSQNESMCLNGQKLALSPTGELPVLSPKVKKATRTTSVTIPGKCIFFVVMPDSKVRTCSVNPLGPTDATELSKRLKFISSDLNGNNEKDYSADDENDELKYVKFSKAEPKQIVVRDGAQKIDDRFNYYVRTLFPKRFPVGTQLDQIIVENDDLPVKYITFNDNSWLSKLTESVGNIDTFKYEPSYEAHNEDKFEKYIPLAIAAKGFGDNSSVDDEKINFRMKRASTEANPTGYELEEKTASDLLNELNLYSEKHNLTKSEKLHDGKSSDLPENIFNTLKDVHVSFSNMEVPSNLPTKKINVRQVDKIAEEEEIKILSELAKEETSALDSLQSTDADDNGNDKNIESNEDLVDKINPQADVQEISPIVSEDLLTPEEMELPNEKEVISPEETEQVLDSGESLIDITEVLPNDDQLNAQNTAVSVTNHDEIVSQLNPENAANSPQEEIIANIPQKVENEEILQENSFQPIYPQNSFDAGNKIHGVHFISNRELFNPPKSLHDYKSYTRLADIPPNPVMTSTAMPPNYITVTEIIPEVRSDHLNKNLAIEPYIISEGSNHKLLNSRKEKMIDSILSGIVLNEDIPKELYPTKEGMVQEYPINSPLIEVPIPDTQEKLYVPIENRPHLNKQNKGNTNSLNPPTLLNYGETFQMPNEGLPTVKVQRQVTGGPQQHNPMSLHSSSKRESPHNPKSHLTKFSEPLTAEMLKAKLEDRLGAFKAKLQEARDKLKAATSNINLEENIKSSIQRRESELKNIFKSFDKRETQNDFDVISNQLPQVNINDENLISSQIDSEVKIRPRRLSSPPKRESSTDQYMSREHRQVMYSQPATQEELSRKPLRNANFDQPNHTNPPERKNQYLFPLDQKTQGIVYNNKIYPAKLFGMVGVQESKLQKGPEVQLKDYMNAADKNHHQVDDYFSDQGQSEYLSPYPVNSYIGSERNFENDYEQEILPPQPDYTDYSPIDQPRKNQAVYTSVSGPLTRKRDTESYIPVVILSPEDHLPLMKYTVQNSPERIKRSVQSEKEDSVQNLKTDYLQNAEEYVPSLASHVNKPWQTDLAQSRRLKRSVYSDLSNDINVNSHKKYWTNKDDAIELDAIKYKGHLFNKDNKGHHTNSGLIGTTETSNNKTSGQAPTQAVLSHSMVNEQEENQKEERLENEKKLELPEETTCVADWARKESSDTFSSYIISRLNSFLSIVHSLMNGGNNSGRN